MEAIDDAPIFMVILSPHALDRCANADDWVRREIEYALERGRHFIPVDPDRSFSGFPPDIPDTLKAELGQHQFSQVMFDQLFRVSVDKMVRERIEPLLQRVERAAAQEPAKTRLKLLSKADCRVSIDGEVRAEVAAGKLAVLPLAAGEYWLEAVGTAGNTANAIARAVTMGDHDQLERLEFSFLKYKVGDYYCQNGKEGIVFEVDDITQRHGKIVGLKHSDKELTWCIKEEYEKGIATGATDRFHGMHNQQAIERIANWREKYPAFAWCAEQGEDWYLPAIEELKTLLSNKTVYEAVNHALARHGIKMFNIGDLDTWYWSSTEDSIWRSWFVGMFKRIGDTGTSSKYICNYVRAVSTFSIPPSDI